MANLINRLIPESTLFRSLLKRRASERYQALLMEKTRHTRSPFLSHCEIRPIKSLAEFKSCSRLVLKEHIQNSRTVPYQGRLWFTYNMSTRKATTFIALYKKKYIVGTFTIIYDSALGLPMDKVFKMDIEKMRHMGCSIAEGTMLCLNKGILDHPKLDLTRSDRLALLLSLVKEGFNYLNSSTKIDTLITCCSVRHAKFLKAILFQQLGEPRPSTGSDQAFAPGYFLDLGYLNQSLKGPLRRLYTPKEKNQRSVPQANFSFPLQNILSPAH